jgi:hypothetical protein
MTNLDEIDFEIANEDLDSIKELQRDETNGEWSERENLTQIIKNGDYSLAIQLNKGLKLFGNSQIIFLTGCPFKWQIWQVYELLGMLNVDISEYGNKKILNDCKNELDFLQFLCENDCKRFYLEPQKNAFIEYIRKVENTIDISFKKMEFSISNQFSKTKWNVTNIMTLLEKLENILNVDVDKAPENNDLPF